jgi:hypothetical protein
MPLSAINDRCSALAIVGFPQEQRLISSLDPDPMSNNLARK